MNVPPPSLKRCHRAGTGLGRKALMGARAERTLVRDKRLLILKP